MKRKFIIFFIILIVFFTNSFPQLELKKFFDDFENGTARNWEPNNPQNWEVIKENNNYYYHLRTPGQSEGTIRKPGAFSLIKDLNYTDFTMTLKGRCLRSVETRGRDIILVFGYQDQTHFYYAHLSNYHDDVHNSILIVNGQDRKPILTGENIPRLKDKKFHDIRLRRDTESGLIEVYVDDFEFPIMTAVDKTFIWGRIGMGSFDDTAGFDDVKVVGRTKR